MVSVGMMAWCAETFDESKARLLISGLAFCATSVSAGAAVAAMAANTAGASACCSSLRYSESLRL